jgi:hypothetical protein
MELIGDAARGTDPVFLVSGAGSGLDILRSRGAAHEPPTIYPHFPAKGYIGFALLEISQNHLAISFYDRSGTRTAGPFLITKHS